MIEALLAERKIILVSSHLSLLNQISESLVNLLFPFYWHHIFIPVLPARLLNYLQAPLPYLIGVDRSYFPLDLQKESLSNDAIVMDIDQDLFKAKQPPVSLPSREKRKLLLRIKDILGRVVSTDKTPRISKVFYEAFPDEQFIPLSCESFPKTITHHLHGNRVSEENSHYALVESPLSSPLDSREDSLEESTHSRKSTASVLRSSTKSHETFLDRIKIQTKLHSSLSISSWRSDSSFKSTIKNEFKSYGHILNIKRMNSACESKMKSKMKWESIHNDMKKSNDSFEIPLNLCRLCFKIIEFDFDYYECQCNF